MAERRVTRRQILKTAGAAGVAATAPWWLVKTSHAQRAKKIVFWHVPNFTPLADELQKQQVYEFAKQAGVKESEVEYATVANEQVQPKLAAAIEAGNPPDVMRLYESNVQFYAAGGHLLDVHDIVEKMRREPKGIFESAMASVVYKGRAMGVPLAVNPWPVHARLDLLEQARLEYPKTWDEFIETSKKIQSPPRLYAFGMSLGLAEDTTDNVMNLLWCYGGKMVEADDKTVVMNSPGNLAGVKVIEAMFKTHKIIPPGSISWDNSGNNKAYQSRQAAFVMNPSSIYAYLNGNDQDLQKVTGLFPVPAGPKGTVNQIDTWAYGAFNRIIQSTGGRWVPVYKRLFESPFWTSKPEFKHFIKMAETGVPVSYAGSPTAAAGEVLNTHVIPKMIQRVLVENWEAARALDECHKKIVEIYTRTAKG